MSDMGTSRLILSSATILIPAANLLLIQSLPLGIIGGFFYLAWWARHAGKIYAPERRSYASFIIGAVILLEMLIAAGYAFFYLHRLTSASAAGILVAVPVMLLIKKRALRPDQLQPATPVQNSEKMIAHAAGNISTDHGPSAPSGNQNPFSRRFILPALHLVLVALCFMVLGQSQTGNAIRSPWEALPEEFFILYFLASLALVGSIIIRSHKPRPDTSLLNISLHTLLTASVAVAIYQVGYGFDPFIHRATEKILLETGTISPKPLMYIGQYALAILLHHLTQIPLVLIDKWLVPILGSILIPPVIYFSLSQYGQKPGKKTLLFSALLPLFLPFSFLFVTVPQNLANIFLMILSFTSLPMMFPCHQLHQSQTGQENTKQSYSGSQFLKSPLRWPLALVILFIHPLAGIPAFIFAGISTFLIRSRTQTSLIARSAPKITKRMKTLRRIIVAIPVTIVIPIFFLIAGRLSPELSVRFNPAHSVTEFSTSLFTYIPFLSILHTAYFYHANATLILAAAAAWGLWHCCKSATARTSLRSVLAHPSIITFIALCANIFALSFLSFSSLPVSEQDEFLSRLWQIALISMMPFMAIGFARFFSYLPTARPRSILPFLLPSALLLINMYFWYPRVDELAPKARGFAVSQNDLATVRWIENNAAGADYVVLANQSVSAAALQEFGFKQYYQNQSSEHSEYSSVFFYPIPTGGPLYQLYLKMVYESPDRAVVEQALRLTGAERAYFVVNDYWLDAEKIKKTAANLARSVQTIGSSTVFIY